MSRKKEEDEQVLFQPDKMTSRSRMIVLGSLNLMKRGHVELLIALLVGGLIVTAFFALALIPVFLPRRYENLCNRFSQRHHNGAAMNIYFIKHENRTWTDNELCYIETAARHYPDFNILMINLVNENSEVENKWQFFDELIDQMMLSSKKDLILYKNTNNQEANLRAKLSDQIPNVRNIDMSVKRFFSRSRMLKKINDLTSDKIELAAKFQMIWDWPGISLEPFKIHQLKSINKFFNKEVDVFASIQIDGDLQAASVPCQSFIGYVIGEMAKYKITNRQTVLMHALTKYCQSNKGCAGVRIIDPIFEGPRIFTTCPTVDSMSY